MVIIASKGGPQYFWGPIFKLLRFNLLLLRWTRNNFRFNLYLHIDPRGAIIAGWDNELGVLHRLCCPVSVHHTRLGQRLKELCLFTKEDQCLDFFSLICICVWQRERRARVCLKMPTYMCRLVFGEGVAHMHVPRVHVPSCCSSLMMCNESQSEGSILYHCSLQI